jgi:hypothetical protein
MGLVRHLSMLVNRLLFRSAMCKTCFFFEQRKATQQACRTRSSCPILEIFSLASIRCENRFVAGIGEHDARHRISEIPALSPKSHDNRPVCAWHQRMGHRPQAAFHGRRFTRWVKALSTPTTLRRARRRQAASVRIVLRAARVVCERLPQRIEGGVARTDGDANREY